MEKTRRRARDDVGGRGFDATPTGASSLATGAEFKKRKKNKQKKESLIIRIVIRRGGVVELLL